MECEQLEVIDKFRRWDVAIGCCSICGQKRILIIDEDEGYCNRCISDDEYLKERFEWI